MFHIKNPMIILGIESSCDDTAAALIENGTTVLSSVVSSQVDVHHKYGGVVPEIASRMHIESILPVVIKAVKEAGISLDDIGGVAATKGPGLIGALLVGFSFAKAFAWARKIPFAGVNHLEGHLYSLLLNADNNHDDKNGKHPHDPPNFPFTALLASGGHTNIYHVETYDDFELMGQTRDDAAGEAFDKVAKMLGRGYPGGLAIEELALHGDSALIKFPRSFLDKDGFDFSFSGLKSAVARYVKENKASLDAEMADIAAADIAAGFQEAVFDVLSFKLIRAALSKNCSRIAVAGGVSANSALRARLSQDASAHGMKLYFPLKGFCGDNAAMIGARGYRLIKNGNFSQLNDDVFSRDRIKIV